MKGPFVTSTYGYLKSGAAEQNSDKRPFAERYYIMQPRSDPSVFNNPTLAAGNNFGGQDGDRSYPIRYTYNRHSAGVGFMYDTRDFVNHNLDGRSNDYMPRLVPDASAVGGVTIAAGFTPVNPNGTTNCYNPPHIVHGLPPTQSSRYYFMQS